MQKYPHRALETCTLPQEHKALRGTSRTSALHSGTPVLSAIPPEALSPALPLTCKDQRESFAQSRRPSEQQHRLKRRLARIIDPSSRRQGALRNNTESKATSVRKIDIIPSDGRRRSARQHRRLALATCILCRTAQDANRPQHPAVPTLLCTCTFATTPDFALRSKIDGVSGTYTTFCTVTRGLQARAHPQP